MFDFKNTSLRNKLIIIQVFTAFMAVLMCCAFFFYNDLRIFKETSVKNKFSIAQIVGVNAASALEFADQDAARQMLAKLNNNTSVLNVIIYDKDGKAFSRYDRTGEEGFVFPTNPTDERNTQSSLAQKFVVSYNISDKDFLGTVKMRAELTGFKEIILNYLRIALFILLASLAAALFISTFLQRSITTRLLGLMQKTKEVTETGDYTIRVPAEGKDEIKTLSGAFNNMLNQIEKVQSELHQSNVKLEDRVKRRTAELEIANSDLKDSEEQIQTIFRTAPNALVVINEMGNVTGWNRRAEEIFGWVAEEIMDKPMHEIIMPVRYRQMHINGIRHFLLTGEGPVFNKSLELAGLRKGDIEFPIEIRISYTKPKDKYVFIAFISDITERKEAEIQLQQKSEELIRSNLELGQYAYVASHDLQEPLRTVTNYVGLLQEKYADKSDEETQLYLRFVVKAATTMKNLINHLLDFSRIGRNVTFALVDSAKIITELVEEMEGSIKESNVEIVSQDLPVLTGNAIELRQLFQNLISNAIKFRKKDVPLIIQISAKDKPGEWLFAVQDNGIGIEQKYQEKIFVIFQRLHNTSDYPGTGIGLATCKKIVSLHNGRIWVESQPGEGSTFYFTISKYLKSTTQTVAYEKN